MPMYSRNIVKYLATLPCYQDGAGLIKTVQGIMWQLKSHTLCYLIFIIRLCTITKLGTRIITPILYNIGGNNKVYESK